jgi:hypothetical protein
MTKGKGRGTHALACGIPSAACASARFSPHFTLQAARAVPAATSSRRNAPPAPPAPPAPRVHCLVLLRLLFDLAKRTSSLLPRTSDHEDLRIQMATRRSQSVSRVRLLKVLALKTPLRSVGEGNPRRRHRIFVIRRRQLLHHHTKQQQCLRSSSRRSLAR